MAPVTFISPGSVDRHDGYTVADYLQWPDDLRCELIDGEIYDMSPAPVIEHQQLGFGLARYLADRHDERKRGDGGGGPGCEVLIAPVDVVLGPDTVVQPDIVVVCDPAKLANGKYVDGAPDAVVEVLSPSTALKDKREKLALYERAGVAEYLILDPHERYAEYYRLSAGRYDRAAILGPEDPLPVLGAGVPGAPLGEVLGWQAEQSESNGQSDRADTN